MNTARFTFRVAQVLADRIRQRSRDLGFRDPSAYFRALIMRDLMHSWSDEVIRDMANSLPTVRQYMIQAVFKLPRDQKQLLKTLKDCGL